MTIRQASTTSYLLMRRNDFPREIRHSHPDIPMTYQIEAEDEAVDVPARGVAGGPLHTIFVARLR